MTPRAPGAEGGGADPHRLSRVHVENVRMDRIGGFHVVLSDGATCTWDSWCRGVRDDIRTGSAARAGTTEGET